MSVAFLCDICGKHSGQGVHINQGYVEVEVENYKHETYSVRFYTELNKKSDLELMDRYIDEISNPIQANLVSFFKNNKIENEHPHICIPCTKIISKQIFDVGRFEHVEVSLEKLFKNFSIPDTTGYINLGGEPLTFDNEIDENDDNDRDEDEN